METPLPPAEATGPRRDGRWMLAGALLGGLLSLPLLRYHLAWDQGIYATIADTLNRGGTAYRDAWEFRPPGIFGVYWAALCLFGRAEWGVRVLEVLALAASGAALVRIASARFAAPRAGLVAAGLLPLFYVPLGHWDTAHCESFQIPLLLCAWALWPRPDDPRAGRLSFASGLLVGAAGLVKTTGGIFGLLLVVDCLAWPPPRWREKVRRAGCTCAGGLLLPALTIAWYGLKGVLPEYWGAVVGYAMVYAGSPGGSLRWSDHFFYLGRFPALTVPIGILCLLGAIRAGRQAPGETLRGLAWTSAAFAVLMLQRRYYPFHFLPVIPFVALGIGLGLAGPPFPSLPVSANRARIARWGWAGVLLLLAALTAPGPLARGAERWSGLFRPEPSWTPPDEDCRNIGFSYVRCRDLAAAVQEATAPDDEIFVWGMDALVYYLADRRMAGPYSHLGMLLPQVEDPKRFEAWMRRLESRPPRAVVTGGRGDILQRVSADRVLEGFPRFREFLESRYQAGFGTGPYRIWLLR